MLKALNTSNSSIEDLIVALLVLPTKKTKEEISGFIWEELIGILLNLFWFLQNKIPQIVKVVAAYWTARNCLILETLTHWLSKVLIEVRPKDFLKMLPSQVQSSFAKGQLRNKCRQDSPSKQHILQLETVIQSLLQRCSSIGNLSCNKHQRMNNLEGGITNFQIREKYIGGALAWGDKNE